MEEDDDLFIEMPPEAFARQIIFASPALKGCPKGVFESAAKQVAALFRKKAKFVTDGGFEIKRSALDGCGGEFRKIIFEEVLLDMVKDGLVDVGLNEAGEFVYRATERGLKRFQRLKDATGK